MYGKFGARIVRIVYKIHTIYSRTIAEKFFYLKGKNDIMVIIGYTMKKRR